MDDQTALSLASWLAEAVTVFGTLLLVSWALARGLLLFRKALFDGVPRRLTPRVYGIGPSRVARRTVPLAWLMQPLHGVGCDCADCLQAGSWDSECSADAPAMTTMPAATAPSCDTLRGSTYVNSTWRLGGASVVPFLGFGGGLIRHE